MRNPNDLITMVTMADIDFFQVNPLIVMISFKKISYFKQVIFE